MIADFLTMYAWIFWVALLLLFVIIEVLTVDFTFLMLAGGCLGGLSAGLLGAPFWAQILVAGVLALLLLFILRPAIKRALGRGGDQTPTNVAALLGLGGTATTGRPVETGDRVVVTAIEGATAIVVPAEGTAL
jgi:membrane protein implicated in regulation of membrane protease activity